MSRPANTQIGCPNCGAFFSLWATELKALSECPACRRPTEIIVFPAYDRPVSAGVAAEKVIMDGEATCFYHPDHRALVPCDACGRFICGLCDLDVNGRHFCPQCLEKAMTKNTVQSLERNRTRWDYIVFVLLVLPLVFCYVFVPATALAALGVIAWKWKSPPSLVSNTRVRFIVYSIIALVEFVVGSILWWMMIFHHGR